MNSRYFHVLGLAGALAGAQFGCGDDGDDLVEGSGIGVDQTTQPLSFGTIESVNGTYGAMCAFHPNGNWSVKIAGTDGLDHAPLVVVRNDNDCELTLTGLHTTAGLPGGTTFPASPSFVLHLQGDIAHPGWQAEASSFGGGSNLFFANGRISGPAFSDNFTIAIVYSNDPDLATGTNTAVVTSQASADSILSPNYLVNVVRDLSVTVDVGTGDVTAAGGTVDLALVNGGQSAENYAVVDSAIGTTYDAINTAYMTASGADLTFPLETLLIPADAFDLVGAHLPTVRTLILAHTDADTGINTYESFEITFTSGAE